MLQSVIATVNQLGIKSLRLEDDVEVALAQTAHRGCTVWAILDSRDLLEVRRALLAAEPQAALRLLSDRAVWIGSLPG